MKKTKFYKILNDNSPGGDLKDSKGDPNRKIYFTRIYMGGLEEMHGYSIDERLYEYFEYKPFKTIEDTRHYLQKLIDLEGDESGNRTAICWFIRRIADDGLIGTARLVDIDYKKQSVSWGYAIDPELWGEGYIFEIQELLKEYVFEILELNRLYGFTFVNNERTKSSLIAAGFKKEGVLRDYYQDSSGAYFDAWAYEMLSIEYFSKKPHDSIKYLRIEITKEEIVSIIAKELNDDSIKEDCSMKNYSNWDSLSHINVILAIEKTTGFSFSAKEIALATSVESIHEILKK